MTSKARNLLFLLFCAAAVAADALAHAAARLVARSWFLRAHTDPERFGRSSS